MVLNTVLDSFDLQRAAQNIQESNFDRVKDGDRYKEMP